MVSVRLTIVYCGSSSSRMESSWMRSIEGLRSRTCRMGALRKHKRWRSTCTRIKPGEGETNVTWLPPQEGFWFGLARRT